MRATPSANAFLSRLRSRASLRNPPTGESPFESYAWARPDDYELRANVGVWRGVDGLSTIRDPSTSLTSGVPVDADAVPGPKKSVTIVLTSSADLHRVPYLLPASRYYVCQVIIVEDQHSEIDVATWTLLNERGVIVQFSPAYLLEANTGLDSILTSASGDLIVALDSYRCADAADVEDLLRGDLIGAGFMKDYLIFGDSTNDIDLSYGRREASIASRYSAKHGTQIRDFGVGSFALQRELVDQILSVSRLHAGLGSPLGREALASLALAASTANVGIHESAVYAYERVISPLNMELLDQIRPVPVRLSAAAYIPNEAVARTLR